MGSKYLKTLHLQLRKLMVINSYVQTHPLQSCISFRNKYVFSSLQQKCSASQSKFKDTGKCVYSQPIVTQNLVSQRPKAILSITILRDQ